MILYKLLVTDKVRFKIRIVSCGLESIKLPKVKLYRGVLCDMCDKDGKEGFSRTLSVLF